MNRVVNWSDALAVVLADFGPKPFAYGESDCVIFARATIEALTGRDIFDGEELTYNDKAGALTALKDLARVSGVEKLMDKFLGKRQDFAYCQRGDIVSATFDFGVALGVCVGNSAPFIKGDGMFERVFLKDCRSRWEV